MIVQDIIAKVVANPVIEGKKPCDEEFVRALLEDMDKVPGNPEKIPFERAWDTCKNLTKYQALYLVGAWKTGVLYSKYPGVRL